LTRIFASGGRDQRDRRVVFQQDSSRAGVPYMASGAGAARCSAGKTEVSCPLQSMRAPELVTQFGGALIDHHASKLGDQGSGLYVCAV
jgi:hypothetical protein